uniref:UTP23 small subunit processome component n=1 Tax=Leptobrachium leishanense TaxID=445787 RepID=A0A8C5MHA4_9ANUR
GTPAGALLSVYRTGSALLRRPRCLVRRTGEAPSLPGAADIPRFHSCVLKELESLGKELYGAKLIAQRFQVRSCSHFKDPVSGSVCLLSLADDNNPHHYFIATQDQELSTKIKKRAGVPLMFIIQNTIVLDKPSPKSLSHVQAAQVGQLVPEHQKQNIEHLKDEQGVATESGRRGRKRKHQSGPNPLSCLKKKKKDPKPSVKAAGEQSKRKRKRKRGKPAVLQAT